MKFMNRIKAFFRKNNDPVELDLRAAEIKEGKAFLHTKGDKPVTYLVRASDIEIRLNKDASLSELDILTIKSKTPAENQKTLVPKNTEKTDKKSQNTTESPSKNGVIYADDRFRKRTFSMTVYQEEYDMLMESIKEYGYKRADFVLACVNTANKGSMEKAHKKIIKNHKAMLLEKQAPAKKQAEEAEKAEQAI